MFESSSKNRKSWNGRQMVWQWIPNTWRNRWKWFGSCHGGFTWRNAYQARTQRGGGTWVNVPPTSGFLKNLINHPKLWLLMVNHGKLPNEQYSISRIFSLRSFPVYIFQLMQFFLCWGAVYLQTPDKRLLEIQYFFNFECRVPMFEDPEDPYSWDKIPVGWPDRGLQDFERFWEFTLREIFSGDWRWC